MPVPIVSTTRLGRAPCRAGAMLGERRRIAVVVDEHGQPEPLGHHVPERDVGQRQVDRDHRDPGALVDQAGNPESDRLHVACRRFAHLLDSIDSHVEQRCLIETRDGPLRSVVYSQLWINRAGK